MKYLCLGYLDVATFDSAPESVKQELLNACFAQCVPFRNTGRVVREEALHGPETARCIRPKKGRASVTDGPFSET